MRDLITNPAGTISAPPGPFNKKCDSDYPHWQTSELTEGDGRFLLQVGVAASQGTNLGAFPKL